MQSTLKIKNLAVERDGQPVLEATLSNTHATVSILSYGATLQKFKIAAPGFEKRDVVLGYSDWTSYQQLFACNKSAYFGAIIGPIAGRIAHARVPFQADFFQFTPNENEHLLHGGQHNYSNINWKLLRHEQTPYPSITFVLESNSKIEIPGKLRCEATYTLKEDELELQIKSIAAEDTLVNTTQHSYFNPGGHKGSVLDCQIRMQTQGYLALNKDKLPTGEMIQLLAHDDLDKSFNVSSLAFYPNLDTAFVLSQDAHQAKLIASDGFQLNFSTNQPVFQVYIGGETDFQAKDSAMYHRYSGICFEQQAEPDAPNHVNFSDIYLSKGQVKTNFLSINFKQSQ